MKRMNYIRNNLDMSNPREVTHQIRQEAKKKRDERILELWKKDSEYPNIGDLIQSLKNDKNRVPRQDFIEVQNQLDVSLDSMQMTEQSKEISPQRDKNEQLQENSIFSTTLGGNQNDPSNQAQSPRHSIMTGAETISKND